MTVNHGNRYKHRYVKSLKILPPNQAKILKHTIRRASFLIDSVAQTPFVKENAHCISNSNAVHRVQRGNKMLFMRHGGHQHSADSVCYLLDSVFGVSAIVNAAQTN
jgi:hypothetical protein